MNSKIIYLFILLALSAPCFANEAPRKSGELLLGNGYDSFSEHYKSQCLNNESSVEGTLTTYDFLNFPISNEDLRSFLHLESEQSRFEANGLYEKILARELNSDVSIDLNFGVAITDMISSHGNQSLNSLGQTVKNNDLFRTSCGDRYISEIYWGGILILSVKFNFVSPRIRESFYIDARLDLAGIEDLSEKIQFALDNFEDHVSIDLKLMQIGGDLTKFASTFGSLNFSCDKSTIDQCENSILRFREYIVEPDGFRDQLPYGNTGTIHENLSPLSFVLNQYDKSGLGIRIEEIQDINHQARLSLIQEHLDITEQLALLSNAIQLVSDQEETTRLLNLKSQVASNHQLLKTAIDRCRNLPQQCHEEHNSYLSRKISISRKQLFARLNFMDQCMLGGYTFEDARTLNLILDKLGIHGCLAAHDELLSLSRLDLSQSDITSINPLRALDHFLWLDLSHNQIEDISILETLTGLRFLDLSFNQIDDINPLLKLNNLSVLGLRDLPLNYNNLPSHFLSIPHFIPNAWSSCVYAVEKSIQRGLFDRDTGESFIEIGFAPNFIDYNSFALDGWYLCELVHDNIKVLKF